LSASADNSRATAAEAVVWSTKTAPDLTPAKGAVGADRHLAQVIVIADAGHDEILAFGGRLRRRRGSAAELLCPGRGLGGRTVIDRDLVAALLDEMSRHREPHHAETEKCDFSHGWTFAF
jgi:hypothetical protein